jgi:hypothetical protein
LLFKGKCRNWGKIGHKAAQCNIHAALYDFAIVSEEISAGNGNVMIVTKIGKLRRENLQRNVESLIVTLYDVKFAPGLWLNLFNIGKALKMASTWVKTMR